jgi:hypothetical protein
MQALQRDTLHAFGLQENFSGVTEDHTTVGRQACLRCQLGKRAIEPLHPGDRQTDIHDGRVCAFRTTDATRHSSIPLGKARWAASKL